LKANRIAISAALILLTSCGTAFQAHRFKMYSGERLTSGDTALLDCSDPGFIIHSIDGNLIVGVATGSVESLGRRAFEVLPGEHSFLVQYRTRSVSTPSRRNSAAFTSPPSWT